MSSPHSPTGSADSSSPTGSAASPRGRSAVLISAGTELTEGIIQDSHVRFLAGELTALGFRVLRGVQVPDDAALFRAELDRGAREAPLVLITGGLGPTSDDLTREIVAESAGVDLEFRQEAWDALLARFPGRAVSPTNRKQALAPRGFALIPNPNGTAPGFHGDLRGALVIAMPGPPSELRPMFSSSVVPLLAERFPAAGDRGVLWGTALMVPESSLEEALRVCAAAGPSGANVKWGTRVDEDRIVFSIRGGSASERDDLLARLAEHLGVVRVRRGDTRPAQLLTDALVERGARLALAESCTGGLVGKYLTDLPGSSRVLWGGFISYSNEAKTRLLGVAEGLLAAEGAVSEAVVLAMAEGARKAAGVEAGLAISGIAGPDGGTPDKPVGTVWMAAAVKGRGPQARRFVFSGSRDMIRRRAAVASMLLAECVLREREFLDTRGKW